MGEYYKREMKIGKEYIIKRLTSSYCQPMRVKVLDVTESTVRFDNLDGDAKFREELKYFYDKYEVLEEIESYGIEKNITDEKGVEIPSSEFRNSEELSKFEIELKNAHEKETAIKE